MKGRGVLRAVCAGIALMSFLATPQMATATERDDSLYRKAFEFKDETLALLGRLVDIDSGTGDTNGVNATAAIAMQELKSLGARVETFHNAVGEGENYVATL